MLQTFIFPLMLIGFSEGLELSLGGDILTVPGHRATCGVLRCKDEVGQSRESREAIISKMTIFRKSHFGEERDLVASVSEEQPLISKTSSAAKVDGSWTKRRAEITVYLLRPGDCHGTEFACHVHALDRDGKSLVSKSSVSNPERDPGAGVECRGADVGAQLTGPIQELKVWLESTMGQLEDRLEDKISTLQTRMDDTIQSLQGRIDDKVSAFQNRLDDKITTMQSMFDGNMKQLENRLEDKLDSKMVATTIPSTHAQERQHIDLDEAEDILNETLYSLESNLNATATQAISGINEIFQSEKSKLLADASRVLHEVHATLDTLTSNSNISFLSEMATTLNRTRGPDLKTSCARQSGESSRPVLESYHVVTPPFGGSPYVCDPHTDGGGWIVIQRRTTGNVGFDKDWASYKQGFGAFDDDFWLGNELIHEMTSKGTYELRVDVKHHGQSLFARYSYFYLEDEANSYTLRLGSFRGTAGDAFPFRKSIPFSTRDRDNDGVSNVNCARKYRGGWWFWPANCFDSFLNGQWVPEAPIRPIWLENSVSFSEMKIRRVQD
ncbi:hypothetical protein EGW08_011588 [Elysia chlorotica]|uniref:Fibrinogen C-terminal domain-containing protein n=1 Tax=Elysia chlorotica TaxID=188477 RepID=A0A3S0ZQU5_ELYCH|nr:hypothetical protein EGW08_011588 [Elysia chlorotica]